MDRMKLTSSNVDAEIPAHKRFYRITLCFLLLGLVSGCTAIGPDLSLIHI